MDDGRKTKEPNLEELKKKTDELNSALEECQRQKAEYLAGWQRSRADFLNYKKEEMERMGEILKYAVEELILKMLPILDSFDWAASRNFISENLGGKEKEKVDKTIQGFLQIKTQFQNFLKSQGVEEIKTAVGKKFDPNFQEITEEVEKKDVEAGTVIEEIQKGYTLQDRVIRAAKVKIAK